jgi:hypothetical protein
VVYLSEIRNYIKYIPIELLPGMFIKFYSTSTVTLTQKESMHIEDKRSFQAGDKIIFFGECIIEFETKTDISVLRLSSGAEYTKTALRNEELPLAQSQYVIVRSEVKLVFKNDVEINIEKVKDF